MKKATGQGIQPEIKGEFTVKEGDLSITDTDHSFLSSPSFTLTESPELIVPQASSPNSLISPLVCVGAMRKTSDTRGRDTKRITRGSFLGALGTGHSHAISR